jgi:hypothetical protein
MRRRLVLLVVGLGFLSLATAPQPDTATPQQESAAECSVTIGGYRAAANQVFAFRHWRHGPKPEAVRHLAELRSCVTEPGADAVLLEVRKLFHRHQAYRRVTPFRGIPGEGYWLRWLAVPAWVVRAETRSCDRWLGTRAGGQCRWGIVNEIGACGPYQLNGWIPCGSPPLRHHRQAHALPRGSWAVGW